MDEKTEELRDIFLSVSDEETVTESQTDERGSMTDSDGDIGDRLRAVITEMREEFSFRTDLDVETLEEVIRLFYDGRDDEEIADALSIGNETAFHARMDLHLVHDDELQADGIGKATIDHVRERYAAGHEPSMIADQLECDANAVEHIWMVIETRNRARRVSHRYRTAFEEILTDADLTVQFTADAHEDGLDDATEGAEVDIEF